MSNIAFFNDRKMKQHEFNEVSSGLLYEAHPSDSYVIHYGDIGNKFYIILKGTVSVWLPVPLSEMKRPIRAFLSQIRKNKETAGLDFQFLKQFYDENFSSIGRQISRKSTF